MARRLHRRGRADTVESIYYEDDPPFSRGQAPDMRKGRSPPRAGPSAATAAVIRRRRRRQWMRCASPVDPESLMFVRSTEKTANWLGAVRLLQGVPADIAPQLAERGGFLGLATQLRHQTTLR